MGGHGGLNILPQKRWNVYNFDNREKVRRDEEAAAREEAERRRQARQAELEFKVEKLREIGQSKKRRLESDGDEEPRVDESGARVRVAEVRGEASDAAERPQHINFFEEFEAKEIEESRRERQEKRGRKADEREKGRDRKGSPGERGAQSKGIEKVDGKPTGEPVNENYELGHGLLDKNGKKPWYLYKSFMIDRTRDDQGGASSFSEKEKKKSKSRHRSESGRKSVEELRAERLSREKQEKDKVRRLVAATAPPSSDRHRFPVQPPARYHGSYGNAKQGSYGSVR